MDLFDRAATQDAHERAPLAERMRPTRLEDYVGQEHLLGEGKLLGRAVATGSLPSMVFWGPPGTGKTTLARIVAQRCGAHFEALSAVLVGVKELREAVARAEERWRLHRTKTVLFVDEIHRFNKSQQDALLPHVEKGTLTLLGATTENPSFEMNAALLSRMRVLTLRGLEEDELERLLARALAAPHGLAGKFTADPDALRALAQATSGDARRALTTLEVAAAQSQGHITTAHVQEALQQRTLLYDKAGDEHFSVVSAFIKSMRGSDPDAAVYWLARLVESGEDPRFIVRRMVIVASEDVGNADPQALVVATAALQAVELLGFPEGVHPLAQAVLYLAMAPKSNASYRAYGLAADAVKAQGALPVPIHLRQASSALGRQLGHGRDYKYPHDYPGHHVAQRYLPDGLLGRRFYEPSNEGYEPVHRDRLEELRGANAAKEPGEDG